MNSRINFAAALVAATLLAACGGGGDVGTLTGPGTGAGTGGGGSGGGGGGTTQQIEMGATVGGTFSRGVIGTSVASGSQLAAGGSMQLTLQFRTTSTGAPATDSFTVTFASSCPAGSVTITPAQATSVNGQATATYSYSGGCPLTQDTINATASGSGSSSLVNGSATATVALAPSQVGSIEFVSASPANIGLAGTGRNETSVVTFRVRDQAGGPRPNATVNFTLDTSVGGISRTPTSAVTGPDGTVQTTVKSGSVATTVRVTAATQGASGATISTTSSQLTVTTGLPVQNRFSIAVETHNVEAWNTDGVQVQVTARLADRIGNPVPDGTAIQFQTSHGSITPQCTTRTTSTESGLCTVTWVSQGQRPVNGRSVILATAIGEESFIDVNTNGRFDAGDQFPASRDLAEPFLDVNEDACRQATEPFFDFNNNQAWDTAGAACGGGGNAGVGNGQFNGLLCDAGGPAPCGSQTYGIGSSNLIVWSDNQFVIGLAPSPWDLRTNGTLTISVADARGQVPAAGTTIAFSGGNGQALGAQSCTVPSTPAVGPYICRISRSADSTSDTKTGIITVTSPSGIVAPTAQVSVSD
jgi:hypothetical protein